MFIFRIVSTPIFGIIFNRIEFRTFSGLLSIYVEDKDFDYQSSLMSHVNLFQYLPNAQDHKNYNIIFDHARLLGNANAIFLKSGWNIMHDLKIMDINLADSLQQ